MRLMNSKKANRHNAKWFWVAFAILLLLLLVKLFFFTVAQVTGDSMYPTYYDGQFVLVDKITYQTQNPKIGDVVIAVEPITNKRVIKRITGAAGSQIIYQDKTLVLPEGEYFIEGDNAVSTDSKDYGPIPKERILGKVMQGTE